MEWFIWYWCFSMLVMVGAWTEDRTSSVMLVDVFLAPWAFPITIGVLMQRAFNRTKESPNA